MTLLQFAVFLVFLGFFFLLFYAMRTGGGGGAPRVGPRIGRREIAPHRRLRQKRYRQNGDGGNDEGSDGGGDGGGD